MISREVVIQNENGIYTRTAALLVQKARNYESRIWLEKDDSKLNAKSVLNVLALGLGQGTTVTLICDGADEEKAMEGLVELFKTGFADL